MSEMDSHELSRKLEVIAQEPEPSHAMASDGGQMFPNIYNSKPTAPNNMMGFVPNKSSRMGRSYSNAVPKRVKKPQMVVKNGKLLLGRSKDLGSGRGNSTA
jgi:hypothetical protein